ncbi:hypothetical protein GT045_05195 [Streptomyces sp. SID486]|uniref:hypothetical protein n=1 Tax=unclassified Streptomyces TaxID=2593676 RepID=UPI0013701997|nr:MULTISPECIES: hypothetical protein [unclassified Streptomyces]MYW43077.1 hypothetical protein [Streptomyces sp. SID161]MYX94216.1 hypothetical protein [Streptomyces sp. SID486]
MHFSPLSRTGFRVGSVVLAPVFALLPAAATSASSGLVRAEVGLGCDPDTWRVQYTASSFGHVPGSTVTTRVDVAVVDEYGPDEVTGEGPYGLGSAATTGDVSRKADAAGAWSVHEVLSRGPRPSGHPRSHTRTTTVTVHVSDHTGTATAEGTCTLAVY